MSFVAPAMLLGLFAVAVPILVHMMHRRRAPRVQFPALSYLLRSDKRVARSLRLKKWLLLALRISLFVLLPLAMAQPFVRCGASPVETGDRLPASLVIIVPDGASTSAADGSSTVWDAALDEASDLVRDARAWDRVAVVVAGPQPVVEPAEATEDHGAVQRVLDDLAPRSAGVDLGAAFAAAVDVHAEAEMPIRRTVLVTDGAIGTPPTADDAAGLGRFEVVRVEGAATNLAVSEVTREVTDDGVLIEAVIENVGPARTGVTVTLEVGDQAVGAELVDIGENSSATARWTHRFEAGAVHPVRVRVDDPDGAIADNMRHAVVHLDRGVRALLVSGDPRAVAWNDELYFFERAIEAARAAGRPIDTNRVTADALAGVDLAAWDVIVLANVGALGATDVARIEARVREGAGLWIALGDAVDPDRFNATLGALLPRHLRSIKTLAETEAADRDVMATRVASFDATHPVFRVFAAPGGESIQAATTWRYALLEPRAGAEVRTVATFGDGGPAWIEHDVGRGRVALWTTTLDDDWTDLPIRTAWVPLVMRGLEHLARRGASAGIDAAPGEPVTIGVEAWDPTAVVIRGPTGPPQVLEPIAGRAVAQPDVVGVWQVELELAGETIDAPELAFVVNPPPGAGHPAVLDDATVEAWTVGADESSDATGSDAPTRRRSVWPVVLLAALLALYAESAVSVRRRVWSRMAEQWRARRSAKA